MIGPTGTMRAEARAIYEAAVAGADAGRITEAAARLDGGLLWIGTEAIELAPFSRIRVYGAGKAAVPMAGALEAVLGDRISGGMVVTRYGCGGPLRRIAVREAGHPLPDENGLRATAEIVEAIRSCGAEDLILFVVSGGGSALFVRPAAGITLDEKIETTRRLLRSGAPIREINAVRRRLSAVKGGRLLEIARPAAIAGILLSDVVGDRPEEIASGPTVPPADPATSSPVLNAVIGGNRNLLEHARRRAESRGYEVVAVRPGLTGEARDAAARLASEALSLHAKRRGYRPACLLAGGETTVTVRGNGRGGRCQEFALAAALAIEGAPVVCLAAGSDGIDGPTNAAGALADGETVRRAREACLDPADSLARNDSHAFFQRLDDLIRTGPSRTNVLDLYMFLVA